MATCAGLPASPERQAAWPEHGLLRCTIRRLSGNPPQGPPTVYIIVRQSQPGIPFSGRLPKLRCTVLLASDSSAITVPHQMMPRDAGQRGPSGYLRHCCAMGYDVNAGARSARAGCNDYAGRSPSGNVRPAVHSP